jgi:hypothetical protein
MSVSPQKENETDRGIRQRDKKQRDQETEKKRQKDRHTDQRGREIETVKYTRTTQRVDTEKA